MSVFSLSACAWYDDGFYGGDVYRDYPVYHSYPRTYSNFSTGYYGGYYSGGYRRGCYDRDYYYHSHSGSDHVDTRNLRVVGGSTGGKEKPKGEHSLDWYRDRGYDTRKLKLADPQGDVYHRSSSSSHKSSASSSSSHHKSSDDDHRKRGH